jgi:hypothetical protein
MSFRESRSEIGYPDLEPDVVTLNNACCTVVSQRAVGFLWGVYRPKTALS